MTDERDDGGGAVQSRRPSRRLVDTRRPRCSRLEQHPRNGREWLPGGASGIDESPSIKVIALLQTMPPHLLQLAQDRSLTQSLDFQLPSAVPTNGARVVFSEVPAAATSDVMMLTLDMDHRVRPLVQTQFAELDGEIGGPHGTLSVPQGISLEFRRWR